MTTNDIPTTSINMFKTHRHENIKSRAVIIIIFLLWV